MPPSALAAEGGGGADMDDDFFDAIAEAAAGEPDEGEEGQVRAERIAAAKARIKSKRSELAGKQVQKSIGKV